MKYLVLIATVALAACSTTPPSPQKSAMDIQLDHLERLNTIARASQPPAIINNAAPAPAAPVFNNVMPSQSFAMPHDIDDRRAYRAPRVIHEEPVYVQQAPQQPPRVYVPSPPPGYVQDYTATYNRPTGPYAVRQSNWW